LSESDDIVLPEYIAQETVQPIANLPREAFPDGRKLKELFEGFTEYKRNRKNICLHEEHLIGGRFIVNNDIDSCLGVASSLAVCRQGFYYSPTYQPGRRIRTDLHVTLEVNGVQQMIKDVPHYYPSFVAGCYEISVYAVLPGLRPRPYLHTQFGHNCTPTEDFTLLANNGFKPETYRPPREFTILAERAAIKVKELKKPHNELSQNIRFLFKR
jgi:hypothetical protein